MLKTAKKRGRKIGEGNKKEGKDMKWGRQEEEPPPPNPIVLQVTEMQEEM